ncbi:MAG: hypothetical protein PHH60_00510 [Candidatus Margulisbacteria bacterium]|nr:hypothetical protein [Candidatus Margulisiibacteriota bacterium]
MSELSLNIGISTGAKEHAIKKPVLAPKPQEEAFVVSHGVRESGFEWVENEKSEVSLMNEISDTELMFTTSTTDTGAKVARSGVFSQEMLQDMKNRFKKLFVSAYSNAFSHNRLLAKVAEWMVGNVMERLALMGISIAELDELKSQVRADLISQNKVAMGQVVYDETMLEIVG